MNGRLVMATVLLGVIRSGTAWGQTTDTASKPASAPGLELKSTTTVIAAPPGPYASAEELLTALEQADRGMETLTAELLYSKTFATAGDTQTRQGSLYFQVLPGSRRFAVHFKTTIIGDRLDDDPRQYIFDGQWLIEKFPKDKNATKRQIVPPGETFDPLRIGEGPMPIPIGQKREDILGRYTAELLAASDGLDPVSEGELIKFVDGAAQLKLVPRPERAREDKFTEIRLWYRADEQSQGRLLPRMAKTINARAADEGEEGDESVVQLIGVTVNADIPPGVIDTEIPDGWDVQVMPFREPRPTGNAGVTPPSEPGPAGSEPPR